MKLVLIFIFLRSAYALTLDRIQGTYTQGKYSSISIHKTKDCLFLFYFEYMQEYEPYNSNCFWGILTEINYSTARYEEEQLIVDFHFSSSKKLIKLRGGFRGCGDYSINTHTNPTLIHTRTGKNIYIGRIRTNTFRE